MNARPTTAGLRERSLALIRALALAALVAHFLFAHGCHGDEDHELLMSTGAATGASGTR
jgi:hypothetical protein